MCNEYLRDNLKASNVFCFLPHAQKVGDKDLEDRCWKVIDKKTEEALTSDEFVTVDRSLVESVVKREGLNVKEVVLFKAVDRWIIKEMEKKGIDPGVLIRRGFFIALRVIKRQIIGEEIFHAIRFPLMSATEFTSVAFQSNLLSVQEISDMMQHYNGVLTYLPFNQTPRIRISSCVRFKKFDPPGKRGSWCNLWNCSGTTADRVNFSVNKPIKLHGVQHFGSQGGEYKVTTEVKDATGGSSLVKHTGSYASKKDETDLHSYHGFDVLFDRPVCLVENKEYQLVSLIRGPSSWYGKEGRASVECQGADRETNRPVRITLPFKDQKSADAVRKQLKDLGEKIGTELQPVYSSAKIGDKLKLQEEKPALVNN
ncbi:hypothetical protein ACROYT_G004877 [Oculina patagonica]